MLLTQLMDEGTKPETHQKDTKVKGTKAGAYASMLVCTILAVLTTPSSAVHPAGPSVCRSSPIDKPHIYGINTDYVCDKQSADNSTMKPQAMQLMVYQKTLCNGQASPISAVNLHKYNHKNMLVVRYQTENNI